MRLVTYETDGRAGCGVLVDGRVIEVEPLIDAAGLTDSLAGKTPSVRCILELGPDSWSALSQATSTADPADGHALSDVRLHAPITDPDKILCIGLNYRDHAEEIGMAEPLTPLVFAKFRNSLIGPTDPIVLPDVARSSTTKPSSQW